MLPYLVISIGKLKMWVGRGSHDLTRKESGSKTSLAPHGPTQGTRNAPNLGESSCRN